MTDQTSRSGNPVTMAACACLTALCMLLASAALTGCGPSIKMTALVSMMPDQESFFRNEMVPGFERERRAKILVAHYGDPDSLDEYLRAPGSNIGLVKVPFERRTALIEQGLFKPIADILPPEKLRSFSGDYLLTKLGEVHGRPCLIPRKFETRIMVYDRNRVSDALGMWKKYKNELDAAIKRHNGVGLPADYILENDPNKWDYFDFFVVGWIWSHTQFNGKAVGRIGLRGKRYSGTWLGIVDRIYQLGGDSAAVVSMTGDAVIDAFHWEAVYAASGVYNPAMWEKGWSGADIWKAFADGEVFLSFMTQL
ncbi:MAG: hypothetical protein JXA71_13515, partial [Chitinispirillaceae bacterium]|nr:hypothetical protein [Chitinispirillaceae bacterium]